MFINDPIIYFFMIFMYYVYINILYIQNILEYIRLYTFTQIDRVRSLRELVASSNTGTITITYKTALIILKSFYLSALQYMNNSVIKLDSDTYEIKYVIKGKMYKMIVSTKGDSGPCKIFCIIGDGNDITDDILPFIGPNYNWHSFKYSPRFFGYDALEFEMSNGDTLVFKENETLPAFT